MKITNEINRVSACPILNRHLLSYLVAAALASGPALPAIAQEDSLEVNPDTVPTNKVVATVTLSSFPGTIVVNRDDTSVYVVTSASSVSQIDTKSNSVINNWSVGEYVIGLDIAADGTQLYVGNNAADAVAILNATTGALINTINLSGPPVFVKISPNGKLAYVAVYATGTENTGSVTVIDTATQAIKTTIPIGQSAYDVVFNPTGTLAYVTDPLDETVAVIDTATSKVTHTVSIKASGVFDVVNPVTSDIYVVDGSLHAAGGDELTVIRGHLIVKKVTEPAGNYIGVPAITPNGHYVYVPNVYSNGGPSNYVFLLNTGTYKKVGTMIQVGKEPYFAAIAHNGKFAYVGNLYDNTLSVIQITPAQ